MLRLVASLLVVCTGCQSSSEVARPDWITEVTKGGVTATVYDILPDSDSYDRESFPYPVGVAVSATGQKAWQNGLEFSELTLVEGRIENSEGVAPDRVLFRSRHTGGTLENGDSIVIYGDYGGQLWPIGWFALRPRTGE